MLFAIFLLPTALRHASPLNLLGLFPLPVVVATVRLVAVVGVFIRGVGGVLAGALSVLLIMSVVWVVIMVAMGATRLVVRPRGGVLGIVIVFEAAIVMVVIIMIIISIRLIPLPIVSLAQHPTTPVISTAAASLQIRWPQRIRRVHTVAANLFPIIIKLRPVVVVTRLMLSSAVLPTSAMAAWLSDIISIRWYIHSCARSPSCLVHRHTLAVRVSYRHIFAVVVFGDRRTRLCLLSIFQKHQYICCCILDVGWCIVEVFECELIMLKRISSRSTRLLSAMRSFYPCDLITRRLLLLVTHSPVVLEVLKELVVIKIEIKCFHIVHFQSYSLFNY